MLLARLVICAVALNKMFDIFLCHAITMVLKSLGWFDGDQHLVITELPDGTQVAEQTA